MTYAIETEVFTFTELNEEAKETARDWYKGDGLDYDWWDAVYEDFNTVCNHLGIELKTHSVPLMDKSIRQDPNVYFVLSYGQGDGCSFEGVYSYAKQAPKNLLKYAPQDETLQNIAKHLQETQRKALWGLCADIESSNHETSLSVTVRRGHWYADISEQEEDGISEAMRDLNQWLYSQLKENYDWLNSDEQVDEAITCNEYEFTIDGQHWN